MKKYENRLFFGDPQVSENKIIIVCTQYNNIKKESNLLENLLEEDTVLPGWITPHSLVGLENNVMLYAWDSKYSYVSAIKLVEALQKFYQSTDGPEEKNRVTLLMPGEGMNSCLQASDDRLMLAALILSSPCGIDLYMQQDDAQYEQHILTLFTAQYLHS